MCYEKTENFCARGKNIELHAQRLNMYRKVIWNINDDIEKENHQRLAKLINYFCCLFCSNIFSS